MFFMKRRKTRMLAFITALVACMSSLSFSVCAVEEQPEYDSGNSYVNYDGVNCGNSYMGGVVYLNELLKSEGAYITEEVIPNPVLEEWYTTGELSHILFVLKKEYSERNKVWKAEDFGLDASIPLLDATYVPSDYEKYNDFKFSPGPELVEYVQSEDFHQNLVIDNHDLDEKKVYEVVKTLEASGKVLIVRDVHLGLMINSPQNKPQKVLCGDVNLDRVVDLTDLTELSLALMGEKNMDFIPDVTSDTTKDGTTDLADLAKLKQYISFDITTLD